MLAQSKEPNAKTREHPKILLVDDDAVFGKVMARTAERRNLPFTFISSVKDAYVADLRDIDCDVAIFDYDLGIVTGVQLSRYLEGYSKRFPVLLVSNHGTIEKERWSSSIKGSMAKAEGPEAIISLAIRAFEENRKTGTWIL